MQSLILICSLQEHCNIDFFATELAGQTALHWSLITQTSFSHVSHTSIYFQLHIVQTAPTSKLPNGELTRKFVQNNKLCSKWIKLIDAFLIISMGYSDPFSMNHFTRPAFHCQLVQCMSVWEFHGTVYWYNCSISNGGKCRKRSKEAVLCVDEEAW